MAAQRPTQAAFDTADMHAWLQQLQTDVDNLHQGAQAAYIHQHMLTFNTAHQKTSWVAYQADAADRDYLSAPARVSKTPRNVVWLGIFDTWASSYVGLPLATVAAAATNPAARQRQNQWDLVHWHQFAWAAVQRQGQSGRALFIYDQDANLTDPNFSLTTCNNQRMRNLAFWARQEWGVRELFVGNGGGQAGGQDRCVDNSTAWVERISQLPANKVDTSNIAQDPRFSGFVSVTFSGARAE